MGQIIVGAPVGALEGDPAREGEVSIAPGFGIRANGTAYFNPAGAAAGEAAWMRLSPSGRLKLEQKAPGLEFGLVEGCARPLELAEHVTAPVREKPGVQPVSPTIVTPEIRGGRPVAVGDHVTGAVTEKPGEQPVALTFTAMPAILTGRPVAVGGHVTAELCADGRPVGVAALRTVALIAAGRVVHVAEPQTVPLRYGRPSGSPLDEPTYGGMTG